MYGTRFQQSNLKFLDVLLLTYDNFNHVPAHTIHPEVQFDFQPSLIGPNSVQVMLHYVLGSSQKIGCPNKAVQIDNSNIGRGKYNMGHKVKGHWAFVGVERESGRDISNSCSKQNHRHTDGCFS